MLLGAGGIYLALGDPAEASFLLGFVGVVIALTLIQQRRTQRALEALRELSAPRAMVVRDGEPQRIPARDVVRGDVLILCEGDRVAADAEVTAGELEIDESLLTGESVPVSRSASSPVLAGCVVTRGTARAQVLATGAATQIGRIGASLADTHEPLSPLQRKSRRVVRWLGVIAVGLAVAQALAFWWTGQPLLASLLAGLALAMAILPEEIPVILTIFLALGAWRIARRQVLTRRISAVEALGAITVLAVDKTGTLTENRMAIATLCTHDARLDLAVNSAPDERFQALVESALLACRDEAFDPTERAIRKFGEDWRLPRESFKNELQMVSEYPLTSDLPAMTRVYRSLDKHQNLFLCKGAPEAVAALCGLATGAREALIHEVEQLAQQGLRVIAVARGYQKAIEPLPTRQQLPHGELIGLLGLADPPRKAVPAALARCRQAGIRVVMMTGDHAQTARAIASRVGLTDRSQVTTGAAIDTISETAFADRLRSIDVWARLRPEHKLRLIQGLRQSGEVVAMTGDGVNDAPALKAADVGIAMGARGTDVAREAAALVLVDDSFTSIVEAIAQGRSIYDNISRAIRFACAVHVPIVGLALGATLMQWPQLLTPAQIVLLELLIDPACAIVFEAEPHDERLMRRPPRRAADSPFNAAMWRTALTQGIGLAAILLIVIGWLFKLAWPHDDVRSVAFGSLALCVLLLIAANRSKPASKISPSSATAYASPLEHAPPQTLASARAPATDSVATNRWVKPTYIGVPLLLALLMSIDSLAALMGIASITWPIAAAILATTTAGYAWLALLRLLKGEE